jgi:predicted PurR-regulated permease PerM
VDRPEETEADRPRVKVPLVLEGAAAWGWRIIVVAAAITLLVVVLIQLYVVVVPVVLALFLAAVLEPLAGWLRARRWPAGLAATAVFVGALAVLLLLLAWIGTSVAGQFEDVGEQLQEGVESAKEWAQGEPLNLPPERVDEIERDIRETIRGASAGLVEQAAGQARRAGEVLGGIVLMLFTLFFLIKDGARMSDWVVRRIPDDYRADVTALTVRGRRIMRQYLIATAATGFIDGVLIGIALWVLGVPLVIPVAVLTFLGGFIPLVGATVAGLVAAIVALVTNGLGTALLVVAATIAVQQIEGNLLQPLILERAVRLHPLVTVWAVGAGLVLGGLLGAFLAVPLVAIAVGVGSHYRSTPPEEELPASEPAPEPEPPPEPGAAPEPAELEPRPGEPAEPLEPEPEPVEPEPEPLEPEPEPVEPEPEPVEPEPEPVEREAEPVAPAGPDEPDQAP